MIIKRKYFSSSFLKRLGGNKELKEGIFKALKNGKIDKDLPNNLPEDLRRYITYLRSEDINGAETMSGDSGNGTTFTLYGAESILKQITGEKIPFNVRRTGKKRAVLFMSRNYVLYYDVDRNEYVMSEEANRMDLIGRFANKVFGGDKVIFTSRNLLDAIRYMFKSIVTYYY